MRFARSLTVVAALLAAAPAGAQLREGLYDLAGQTPEGSAYEGAVALRGGPGGAWLVTWQVGNARVNGLGIIHGGVLAVTFEVNGTPGVAAFDVDPAGRLQGTWTTGKGVGREVLTPR